MAESIMQSEKSCIVCGTTQNLHKHHIYHGGNRRTSDIHGFWCWLCGFHHNQSDEGVHGKNGYILDMELKQECQAIFEETHSRLEFVKLIGRNYL